MPLTRENLLAYLHDEHDIDPADLHDDDTPLFSSGLLDSFSMVELVAFIERESATKLRATQVTLNNLDTVSRILGFTAAAP